MQPIAASEETLDKIFSSDYDFTIPNYQRPYAWERDEALQLLEDVATALDAGAEEPYFLGSIVVVKAAGSPAAEVVDGQQRLTTVTILLAVLRDLAESDAPDVARSIGTRIMEPGDPVMQRTPKPRLVLRSRDQPFFRQWVQEPGQIAKLVALPDGLAIEAKRNIRDNVRALLEQLGSWSAERRAALANTLMARTFLVTVQTQDLESAHRIFSVMNSRGLDLTPPDIFKADVIGDIPEGDSDDYTRRWEDAEEEVGRDNFESLFLNLRLIITKKEAQKGLLTEFPTQVLADYRPSRAREFVDEVLTPYARAYDRVLGASYSSVTGADEVNAWLRRLGKLDTTDWQPSALWALRTHGDDPVWLDAFLRKLERLAASMYIRRTFVRPRSERYIQLLTQLADGAGLEARAFELSASERAATIERLDGNVYEATKTRRYILERLDETLADTGVTHDRKVVTVEHVLPQTPKVQSQWLRDFTEGEREEWTNRLANLVLLSRRKNSQAQNYDFDEKKLRYFKSSSGVPTFALTVQVLDQVKWTPPVLQARQAGLIESLTKEWALR